MFTRLLYPFWMALAFHVHSAFSILGKEGARWWQENAGEKEAVFSCTVIAPEAAVQLAVQIPVGHVFTEVLREDKTGHRRALYSW